VSNCGVRARAHGILTTTVGMLLSGMVVRPREELRAPNCARGLPKKITPRVAKERSRLSSRASPFRTTQAPKLWAMNRKLVGFCSRFLFLADFLLVILDCQH
jgi:hypothetical protein